MCILHLCEFHYDYIRNKYSNNCRSLLPDTDGLMYEISIEDVYEDFCKDKEVFKKLTFCLYIPIDFANVSWNVETKY